MRRRLFTCAIAFIVMCLLTVLVAAEEDVTPKEEQEEIVYCYFQAVDSNGIAFGNKNNPQLSETEKRRAGLNPGYGGDSWFVYGKLTTKIDLKKNNYSGDLDTSGNEPFRSAIAELKTDNFTPHWECSGSLHKKGYGDQIQWRQLNYHSTAYPHSGYAGTDGSVVAYHMDGTLTFFKAEFDTNTGGAAVDGLPNGIDGYYVKGAELILPTLTRSGYTFAGWEVTEKKTAEGSETETDAEMIPAGGTYQIQSDVKFTARWERRIYVYFQAVNSHGTSLTKQLTYNEKRRAGIHPIGYGENDDWFVYGKMLTTAELNTGEYTNSKEEPFKTVIEQMANNTFTVHQECSGKFFIYGYGQQIEWTLLKYHEKSYKHPGYASDSETGVVAYHMDGKVTFYNVQFDTNAGGAAVDGLPNGIDGYYVKTANLTLPSLTRAGYTFIGWKAETEGAANPEVIPAGTEATVSADVTYTAQWKRNSDHDSDSSGPSYYFAIRKIDAEDGHALNGAAFALYQKDSKGSIINRTVSKTMRRNGQDGIALFSVDTKGIWFYTEISAPDGYVRDSAEYRVTVQETGSTAAIRNAEDVKNYRSSTPGMLNDTDHFAYVIGYRDGLVKPYGLISRAETTTIFFRLLKDEVRDSNLLTSNAYADVSDDYWANTAISTMTGLGIVQGRTATTFDPRAPITRAQFAAICARFDTGKSSGTQTFSDISGHWAEKYIQRAAELGWIKGFEDGTFRPDTYITRAQAMTMINRVLNRIPEDTDDLLDDMNVWPDCNPGDWFYLAVQEATNSHDFRHKGGNYEAWTKMNEDPDWTRYEN